MKKKDFWRTVLKSHWTLLDLNLGPSSFLSLLNYLTRFNDLVYPSTCVFLCYLLHIIRGLTLDYFRQYYYILDLTLSVPTC